MSVMTIMHLHVNWVITRIFSLFYIICICVKKIICADLEINMKKSCTLGRF